MFPPSPGSQEQSAEEVTLGGSLDGILERRLIGTNESLGRSIESVNIIFASSNVVDRVESAK